MNSGLRICNPAHSRSDIRAVNGGTGKLYFNASKAIKSQIPQLIFNSWSLDKSMTGPDDEVSIEINAPPSIQVNTGDIPDAQPVMITGNTAAVSQPTLLDLSSQNVNFVMGPNGQIIAIEKPAFTRNDFLIGGGIPFAIFFIPILMMMITGTFTDYNYEEVTLTKEEGTTNYTGEFEIDLNNQEVSSCYIDENRYDSNNETFCQNLRHLDRADFWMDVSNNGTTESIKVGYWDGETGIVTLDSGTDYGGTITVHFDYRDITEDDSSIFEFFEEIAWMTCCLGLLASLVMLIVGFASGRPGMGWGGLASLIGSPIVGIISSLFLGW